jgi:excisionase family DNA binding protein
LLTPRDVADRLRLSLRAVRRLIASGELPVLRLGRAVRVTEEDFAALLLRSRR